MDRILAADLPGPRAYFTAFDQGLLNRTENKEVYVKTVERRLKFLLLLKTHVICAASHLSSEVAQRILTAHPYLLGNGLIVPALRVDKESIGPALAANPNADRASLSSFYEEHVPRVVSWRIEDNSPLFKAHFLDELQNKHSVLRRNLSKVHTSNYNGLIKRIRAHEGLSPSILEEATKRFPAVARMMLMSFAALLYHVFGAKSIDSESCLPQEDYVDYDLADIEQRRTRLSEDQIFQKIFLEAALDTLQKEYIPLEFLDYLSFQDIMLIRKPIEESEFRTEYDRFIRACTEPVTKGQTTAVLDVQTLESIRERLKKSFDVVFNKELLPFLRKKVRESGKTLLSSSSSLALDIAGFIPVMSVPAGAISAIRDSRAWMFNVQDVWSDVLVLGDQAKLLHRRKAILEKYVSDQSISDKATMLDLVDLLMKTIAKKMEL